MTRAALRCCDWLEGVRGIAPASVDLLYADPPFNTGQTQTDRAGSFNDAWPDIPSYIAWLRERLAATLQALKRSANILLHVDWRTSHHARLLLDELLGPDRFVNHLIWSYGLGGSSPRRFARKHDDILFYCLDPDLYYFDPPMIEATSQRMKGRLKKMTDIIELEVERVSSPAPSGGGGRVFEAGGGKSAPLPVNCASLLRIPSINNMAHERTGWPTQKPLALLELLVRACAPPGGTVLDPCCGSGTTLVAAARTMREAIGFDVSPAAVQLAQSRLTAVRVRPQPVVTGTSTPSSTASP